MNETEEDAAEIKFVERTHYDCPKHGLIKEMWTTLDFYGNNGPDTTEPRFSTKPFCYKCLSEFIDDTFPTLTEVENK
jgi:hypothetical protein